MFGKVSMYQYFKDRSIKDHTIGIVTTEYRQTSPLDSGTHDPESGYATIHCGTHSVVNKGDKTFYPGNLVCWRFPRAPFHPSCNNDGDNMPWEFNGGSSINRDARLGAPPTQFVPEIVPYDPTDYTSQFSAIFAAITAPKLQGGISDIPYKDMLPSSHLSHVNRTMTCIQDGAGAYQFGKVGCGLRFVEFLARHPGLLTLITDAANGGDAAIHRAVAEVGREIGLFGGGDRSLLEEFMADYFLQNVNATAPERDGALQRFDRATGGKERWTIATTTPSSPLESYDRLSLHLAETDIQGITESWDSKRSHIVGRALNAAAPLDTTHIVRMICNV